MTKNPRLIAAVIVAVALMLLAAGFAGGRKTAPKPPAPLYQQVAFASMGLLTIFNQQGYPVAGMQFESVEKLANGYRIVWIVTDSYGTTARWAVKTDLAGIIVTAGLADHPRHTPKPQAS